MAPVDADSSSRTEASTRPNRAVINLDAVRWNTRAVLRSVDPAAVLAAVKADAYGHGALEVAKAAVEAGAIGAATGNLETALRLRLGGLRGMVLVFPGPVLAAADLEAAARAGITLTVHDEGTARAWSAACPLPLQVFIKISLGLERLGVPPEAAESLARQIRTSARLCLTGVLGHLHAPAGARTGYVQWQLDRFDCAMDALTEAGLLPAQRIVAATGALRRQASLRLDRRLTAVDPGTILLGLSPPEQGVLSNVKPALEQISSQLVQVRPAYRTPFREDAPFRMRPGMKVGVLPIGRADGLAAISAGYVLTGGRKAPILAIWTEHTAIDVTGLRSAEPGQDVVIFGVQGSEAITGRDVAEAHPGTTAVDLAVSLRQSVPRIYKGLSPETPPLAADPR